MPSDPHRRPWNAVPPRASAASFALALAMAVAMLGVAPTSATATVAKPRDAHDRVCGCGPRCRDGACCCGPKSETTRPRPAEPPAEPAADESAPTPEPSGPCLGVAPLGDDATPAKLPPRGGSDAERAAERLRLGDGAGRFAPPPSSDRPHAAGLDRLDRPPRTAAFA